MNRHAGYGINAKLIFISSLLLLALFLALSYNSYRREQDLILKGAIDNARIISRQLIETRDYLSRNITTEANWNENLIPQIAASKIARQITLDSHYYVRQVSLRYRNPDNRPDRFETEQLQAITTAKGEIWKISVVQGEKSLRYMIHMIAEKSCITCHGTYNDAPQFVRERFPRGHFSYGYKIGETIGAISVTIPMNELYRKIGSNLKQDLMYNGMVLIVFIIITGAIIRRTIVVPVRSVATGITDVALTGNFSERLPEGRNDEIGELIDAFNGLMGELERRTLQRVEAEERYRNFIEIAQSPIVTFMADGKIVISNQKAEKLFGLLKEELLGQNIFDFMEKGEELKEAVEEYFSSGSSALIGTTTRQKVRDVCGRLFNVEMVISVSQSDQNQMFSAILRTVK